MIKQNSFSTYILKKGKMKASTVFFPDENLPNLPITTPFTFPFLNNKVCLSLDKMGWWNPLGGHIEPDETWEEALKREAWEEAGAEIKNIRVVGYVKIEHFPESEIGIYPKVSLLPITVSTINEYLEEWKSMETKERGLFLYDGAIELLGKRTDNNQMLEIFSYIINNNKNE